MPKGKWLPFKAEGDVFFWRESLISGSYVKYRMWDELKITHIFFYTIIRN